MKKLKHIARASGAIIEEDVPGGAFMNWLYNRPLGKMSLWFLIKRKAFSVLGGWYMNTKASGKKVAPFINKYNVDIEEYEIPKSGFKTFNQFFYRKIKPQYRSIGDGVVSPSDGRLLVFQHMSDITKFFVKGSEFDLKTFLNDSKLSERYKNGSMAIIRLAPVDYHRFHFPVSGMASAINKIKGDYYSVSPIALGKKLDIFCQNKREIMTVQTIDAGRVVIVDVGATLTGSIIQTYQPNLKVVKGTEKGYFAFGGSTVVLLFESNQIQFDKDLIDNTNNGLETSIKMGEQIAVFVNS